MEGRTGRSTRETEDGARAAAPAGQPRPPSTLPQETTGHKLRALGCVPARLISGGGSHQSVALHLVWGIPNLGPSSGSTRVLPP